MPATARLLHLLAALGFAALSFILAFTSPDPEAAIDGAFTQLYGVVVGILVITWLATDPALPAARRPSLDFGMFLWITFPFLAAWLLFRTRGWRGVLIALGLIAVLLAPQIAFVAAYLFQSGS